MVKSSATIILANRYTLAAGLYVKSTGEHPQMRILKAKPIALGWNTRKKFRRVATFSNFFRKQNKKMNRDMLTGKTYVKLLVTID